MHDACWLIAQIVRAAHTVSKWSPSYNVFTLVSLVCSLDEGDNISNYFHLNAVIYVVCSVTEYVFNTNSFLAGSIDAISYGTDDSIKLDWL